MSSACEISYSSRHFGQSFLTRRCAITPTVVVKDGTKTLEKDTHYTVSYSNNINAGTATVTITGKDNYTGTITIDDKDIILSSIVVKADTQKINYDLNGNIVIEDTLYELKYGKDYYTSKEIENGVTVSRITFYQTTNTPLMDFQHAQYVIEYNQDITAKYYYNDALDVMKESSIPQTTYNINVLDISEAENFLTNLKWYKPQVGTRIPIYDEELRFKGLVGFLNSVTFDLLNPQNTQLAITNFMSIGEEPVAKPKMISGLALIASTSSESLTALTSSTALLTSSTNS